MKKLLSLIIAIAFLLCTLPAAAQEEEAGRYDEDVRIAVELGLLTLENPDARAFLERRDVAQIAVNIMDYSKSAIYNEAGFTDVAQDSKLEYINKAKGLGIMNGFPDGTFRPQQHVSYNEAIKVLVTMTGYDVYAEKMGGYPAGYLNAANRIKLTRGIVVGSGSEITLGEFCHMLHNALETNILETSAIGEYEEFEAVTGKNLLTQKLEMKIIEGQVTANEFMSLGGIKELDKGEIAIDDVVYKAMCTIPTEEIGKELAFYVNKDENIVYSYKEKANRNNEILLRDKDIQSISGTTIHYTDDDKRNLDVKFKSGTDLYLNGELQFSWSTSDIPLNNSQIRLLDTDGDKVYDYIFAYQYKNLIVERYIKSEKIIDFKTTDSSWKSICLNEEDDSEPKYELTDKNGNMVTLDKIKQWDVLSVCHNSAKNIYFIKYSEDSVAGKCVAKGENDEVTVNDTTFFTDAYISLDREFGEIEFNKDGIFYLNFRGDIVGVKYEEEISPYAYLVAMGEGKGLSAEIEIKLYTASGEFKIFTAKKRIDYGGVSINAKDLLTKDAIYDTSLKCAKPQLIKYEANEDVIKSISVAQDATALEVDDASRLDNFTKDDTITDVRYRGGNMSMFASRYIVDDDTVTFVIPTDLTKEEDFRIIRKGGLVNSKTYTDLTVYDVDINSRIAAITMPYSKEIFQQSSGMIGVVTKKSMVINDDSTESAKINLLASQQGETYAVIGDDVKVCVEKNSFVPAALRPSGDETEKYISINDIKIGDIIECVSDASGETVACYLIFRKDASMPSQESGYSIESDTTLNKDSAYATRYQAWINDITPIFNAVRGGVSQQIAADDGTVTVYTDTNSLPIKHTRVFPFFTSTVFAKCSENGKTVESMLLSEIKEGDDIFIYNEGANVRLVVVYE